MLENFALVLILGVVCALFIFITLVAGHFLRPKSFNQAKRDIYECGEKAVGPAWISFNIRFYIIALIFIIFDVEAVLLFPVASVYKKWLSEGQGLLVFGEIALFLIILGVGLAYVWGKRDFNWLYRDCKDR